MAEQIQVTRRISRSTIRGTAPVATPVSTEAAAKQKIDTSLKSIAILQTKTDELAEAMEGLQAGLKQTMVESGIQGYTTGAWTAELQDDVTKGSRTPDPAKVLKKVGQAEFLKLVKVSVTDLKDHMTDREINAISTVIEGKKVGVKLKVTRKKK